ncbi:MAG: hypothetical protein OEV44_03245 [Spirochaetota bacterium]|nr:hypothetical protein [Spirochaetota bacterium]
MKTISLNIIIFFIVISSVFAVNNPNKQQTNNPKQDSDGISVVFDGGALFLTKPASSPLTDPGWGLGYGGGAAIDFGFIQFRFDVHHVKWTKDGQKYWRMPFFLGYRIFPLKLNKIILPFFDFGFELSGDQKLYGEADVHAGFTPGAGLEMRLSPFIMGVNVRYHIIKHPYLSIGPYAGFRF